jgi:hypothetical protein
VRLAHRGFSKGAVAQLVEQRTENPCVGGSIPPHTTKQPVKAPSIEKPFLFSYAGFNICRQRPHTQPLECICYIFAGIGVNNSMVYKLTA